MTAKRRSDRGGRDVHTKPLQLTLDPLIAQRWFSLARRMINCCTSGFGGGRPVWRCGVGPCAGDQPPVPAQQGLRPDEEVRPAGPGQGTADGCEHRAVGRFEPGSWGLAAKDSQLVTEHQNLQVLGGIAPGPAARAAGWSGTASGRRGWKTRSGPPRRSAETAHYRATRCELPAHRPSRICVPYAGRAQHPGHDQGQDRAGPVKRAAVVASKVS